MEQVPSTLSDNPYRRALCSLRAAKNWLWWILFLAVAVDLLSVAAAWWYPDFTSSPSLRADLAVAGVPIPSPTRPAAAPKLPVRRNAPVAVPSATLPAAITEENSGAVTAQIGAATAPAVEVPTGAQPPVEAPAGTRPAARPTAPAVAAPDAARAARADKVYQAIGVALSLGMSASVIGVVLLVGVLAMSLSVVLAGHVGDTGHMAGALVWSLLLAAILMPWHLAFGPAMVPGVPFLRPELIEATTTVTWGARPDWADLVLYQARFVAYPVLALLLLALLQLKSRAGMRQARITVQQ